jgi:hypothetical protein
MENDNDYEGARMKLNPPSARHRWRRAFAGSAAAIMVGSGLVISALGLSAGAQLANSPEAVATTVRATPTMVRPQYTAQAPMTPGQTECDPSMLRAACSPSRPPAQLGSSGSGGAGAAAWFNEAKGPFTAIQNALQTATSAMQAQDMDGVRSACQQVLNNSERLGRTLPSPNAGLTAQVQGAVDELKTAANLCLGPDTASNAESILSHVQNANSHFSAAQQIIESKS